MNNDGGPAFPVPDSMPGDGEGGHGMTIRDWFAAHAPPSHPKGNLFMDGADYRRVARHAYLWADAMLKEREK